MKIMATGDNLFEETFQRITRRGRVFDPVIQQTVRRIVDDVATRGDKALFAYTRQFDSAELEAHSVEVSPQELEAAISLVNPEDMEILALAGRRIEAFHKRQTPQSWLYSDEAGVQLGQRILPLERIGIYAPGGLAAYPSTVLMAAIPAGIANVSEILLVSPARGGVLNPLIAAAARIGGVKRIFKIGGAQAIAALAYGTESVPRVDKIVGPGNAYVAAAKQMVFGQVDIDMIAGPSEVLIIADGAANVAFAAADLIAQAEHDTLASAVLLTPDASFAQKVILEVERQLAGLPKKETAMQSLAAFGAVWVTRDLAEAIAIANRFAPEHLELMVERPEELLPGVRNAGAVFLGEFTPEALGDYLAGPNHILPTGGTARFASPLGVYDFVKRTSVLSFSESAMDRYSLQTERFARIEGLDGHGRSVACRRGTKKA